MEKMETQQNIICESTQCTGCGACATSCHSNCIAMETSLEGFRYPIIDESVCTKCNQCRQTCPQNIELKAYASEFHMAWHKDKDVLARSSSGGVFTALAHIILNNGGVVYGATMNEATKEVLHIAIESSADLDKIRMSKYYQSDTAGIYDEVQRCLSEGRLVLFSGTACQIAAVYTAVGHRYDNLITVDVLCHGVTSKKVVDAYIASKEKKYKKKIASYRFRVKGEDVHWMMGGGTVMKLVFSDGTYVIENKDIDTFFTGYNNNLILRESCYRCKYCGTERIADFTIADFWGVPEEKVSEEQLKWGVSLLLINSEKGKQMIPELAEAMEIHPTDQQEAIPYNRSLAKPNDRPAQRDGFFRKLETEDYDKLIKQIFRKFYMTYSLKRILRKIIGEKNYFRLKKAKRKIINGK